MLSSFDEKGKIFTQVVSKKPVPVIIQTQTHQIFGKIHIRPNDRLMDELNHSEKFIAITDAVVLDSKNQELYRCGFLTLNASQIIWIIPNENESEPGNSQ